MEDSVIVDTVTSYADGFEKCLRELNVDRDTLKDKLLDLNVEQCPNCKIWVESGELIATGDDEYEEGPDGYCENCRRYAK